MIKNAEFITSVGNISQMSSYPLEIAIAGKSNVGKSTFINFICNKKKLAKTSKEPGRTRLLNYFDMNKGEFVLVDLPGYGFAKVSNVEKEKWGKLIETYLQNSKGLKNVFMLVDIRHMPSKDDMNMLKYLYYYMIPFTIIATKCDKLSRSAGLQMKKKIADYIGVGVDNILMSSSTKYIGDKEIYQKIDEIIDFNKSRSVLETANTNNEQL
ncbi:MAG: ribosome biogenesis GTP-binding protein YihA/YsxC [Clostridia bacterium]